MPWPICHVVMTTATEFLWIRTLRTTYFFHFSVGPEKGIVRGTAEKITSKKHRRAVRGNTHDLSSIIDR
jgi:hypothetical protein